MGFDTVPKLSSHTTSAVPHELVPLAMIQDSHRSPVHLPGSRTEAGSTVLCSISKMSKDNQNTLRRLQAATLDAQMTSGVAPVIHDTKSKCSGCFLLKSTHSKKKSSAGFTRRNLHITVQMSKNRPDLLSSKPLPDLCADDRS